MHLLDEVGALLVQFVHGHAGGDGAQGVDELAFDQILQRLGHHGALSQRLRGHGDRACIGPHADIEFGLHVDTKAVQRNQRFGVAPYHGQHHGVHVDRHRFVEHRQHQRAAVHHDFFPAHARAHESDFFRSAAVQPCNCQPNDQNEYDDRTNRYRQFYKIIQSPLLEEINRATGGARPALSRKNCRLRGEPAILRPRRASHWPFRAVRP